MGSVDISKEIFISPEQIKFIEEMIGKPNSEYHHVACSADRKLPVGCKGCACKSILESIEIRNKGKIMDELIEELSEYADLDGTEVGEYWAALVDMCRHSDAMGDTFSAALDAEIKEQIQFIKDNFEIVEEETQSVTYKYKSLEYKG